MSFTNYLPTAVLRTNPYGVVLVHTVVAERKITLPTTSSALVFLGTDYLALVRFCLRGKRIQVVLRAVLLKTYVSQYKKEHI